MQEFDHSRDLQDWGSPTLLHIFSALLEQPRRAVLWFTLVISTEDGERDCVVCQMKVIFSPLSPWFLFDKNIVCKTSGHGNTSSFPKASCQSTTLWPALSNFRLLVLHHQQQTWQALPADRAMGTALLSLQQKAGHPRTHLTFAETGPWSTDCSQGSAPGSVARSWKPWDPDMCYQSHRELQLLCRELLHPHLPSQRAKATRRSQQHDNNGHQGFQAGAPPLDDLQGKNDQSGILHRKCLWAKCLSVQITK